MRRGKATTERSEDSEGRVKRSSDLFIARFPGLVDVVSTGDKLVFAVVKGGNLEACESVLIGDNEYKPPPRKQLPWHGRGIPRWEQVREAHILGGDPAQLFFDVVDYLRGASCLPGQGYYALLAT